MKFSEVIQMAVNLAKKANDARARKALVPGDYPIVASGAPTVGSGVLSSPGPGSYSLGPGPSGTPTAMAPAQEEIELRRFLESQSPETVYMLTAIMYLGRGDFDAARLLDNYDIMKRTFGDPTWAARQMADKFPLPRYLEEGWKKAVKAGLDLDAIVCTETS